MRRNNKSVYLTLFTLFTIYLIYTLIVRNNHDVPLNSILGDGITTKGFGIVKGGTGFVGFQKEHRDGRLPPVVRRQYDDKEMNIFDAYDVNSFEHEDTETFDKDTNKIIIVLGANLEGGVNKWKGPNEWSIERSSILNKRQYADAHGYELVVKDFTKAKKYSKDHREGWQKFDIIKDVIQEANNGDWIWYVDLYTLIMEPQVSLEELIFNQLDEVITRDLTYFNPSKLDLDLPFLGYDEPINFILSQDCGGFNLNSFFIKKTKWSSCLLDVLFDPIVYLQNMENWTNGEKNALEYYYNAFSWVRARIAFVSTRLISSLPHGACPDYAYDDRFFYNESQRDFLVSMVGCDFNRNCWDEVEYFKELSLNLHKKWFKWFR